MKSYPFTILKSTRQYSLDAGKDVGKIEIKHWYKVESMHRLFRSDIVIVQGPIDFCCIKNRYGVSPNLSQRIPNFLLKPYLAKQLDRSTKEDLIDVLIDSLTQE